jgi:hypothetical protein
MAGASGARDLHRGKSLEASTSIEIACRPPFGPTLTIGPLAVALAVPTLLACELLRAP